jgi:hypothetical protein
MTCGVKHVKFWEMTGQNIKASKGLLSKVGIQPILSCCYAFKGRCFVGTEKGLILEFKGRNAARGPKGGHKNKVYSLIGSDIELISGGMDGLVIFWNSKLDQTRTVDIAAFTKNIPAGIKSLDYNSDSGLLLVGTQGAQVIEVDESGKSKILM